MNLQLVMGSFEYSVAINRTKNGFSFKINDEKESEFLPIEISPNCFKLNINGVAKTVYVATDKAKGQSYIHIDGQVIPIQAVSEEHASAGAVGEEIVDGRQKVHAPMPGKIVKIPVVEGQRVMAKAILCVVEAMKMENEIRAKFAGVVREIKFKAGDLVGTEETILVLEKAE